MRLPVKDFMRMEAERLPDGRVRFVVSEYGFLFLHAWLGEALEVLWRKEREFPTRVGLALEEAESLRDEFYMVRFGPLGYPRRDPQTKRLRGPDGVRKTGTAWNELPKMEARVLSDGRLELKLARGELAVLANCVEVAIEELVPTRSAIERREFRGRKGATVEEAEELRDELQRLDREVRDDASHGSLER